VTEVVQDAQAAGITAPEAVSVPDFTNTKHKLKVNGQEREYDYQTLVERAQKAEAADEKFRQAAEFRKEAEEFRKKAEDGDLDWLEKKLGPKKFREHVENYLLKQIEFDELPEPEKRARQLERELEAEKLAKKQLEDKLTADERAKIEAQAFDEIDQEIGAVLKASGQKPTPRLVARIAETMLASLEATEGKNKVKAEDAYKLAKKGILDDISEYLPTLGVDELRAILPKQVLEALRKSEVEMVRKADPLRSKLREKTETVVKRERPKGMSTDEYFNRIGEKFN